MNNTKIINLITLIILISLILLIQTVSVAEAQTNENSIIHGTIYNSELDPITTAIIVINTTPTQKEVIRNGTYSLSVPKGHYTLIIRMPHEKPNQILYSQEINITESGNFLNDIIIPFENLSISEPVPTINNIFNASNNNNESKLNKSKYYNLIIILSLIVIFILLIVSLYLAKKIKRKNNEIKKNIEDIEQPKSNEMSYEKRKKINKPTQNKLENLIIDYIKSKNNLTTQKEIKKKFSLSNTKVSLVLSTLESQGLIIRIKKGRINIIKLKQNN